MRVSLTKTTANRHFYLKAEEEAGCGVTISVTPAQEMEAGGSFIKIKANPSYIKPCVKQTNKCRRTSFLTGLILTHQVPFQILPMNSFNAYTTL